MKLTSSRRGSLRPGMKLTTYWPPLRVVVVAGAVLAGVVTGWTPAGASYVEYTAFDPVAQSINIPVTNASNGVTWSSVLVVNSATLDTTSPDGRGFHAPRGQIYLSLQMSSGPVQQPSGNQPSGSFFSTMTPLPAAALHYVVASGRSYQVTRANPINQTYNPNATIDDGLVDATYFFTVPISNRRGTLVISPTSTMGVQFKGFVGGPLISLKVGGPTRIALSFPKELTVAKTTTSTTATNNGSTTLASGLNLLSTLLAALLVGIVFLALRRRKKRRAPIPVVVMGTGPVAAPQVAPVVRTEQAPRPEPRSSVVPTPVVVDDGVLRVNVLGPLTIWPTNASASDPVRAILAYLAMNGERVQTLEEIQNAIWPLTENGTDIKKPAMHNYMMQARKCVGERHLPTASGRPGYQLQYFDTDWTEFQGLLLQATKVSKTDALALRLQALDLAKGLPFTADTTRYFAWAYSTSVVYKIVEAVTALAHGLGTDLVLAGDLTGAQVVLRQGLLTDPASLTLWEDLTDVLLESADQSLLVLHWKGAGLVLRPEDVVLLRSRVDG